MLRLLRLVVKLERVRKVLVLCEDGHATYSIVDVHLEVAHAGWSGNDAVWIASTVKLGDIDHDLPVGGISDRGDTSDVDIVVGSRVVTRREDPDLVTDGREYVAVTVAGRGCCDSFTRHGLVVVLVHPISSCRDIVGVGSVLRVSG